MARWLASLVLHLYPLGFRRRYGAEMSAVVDDTPARLTTSLDLLRGAVLAHVRPPDGLPDVDVGDRLRASASGVLASWVVFAAAGFGFYKTTEDGRFSAAGNAHALLGGVHIAVQVLAIVASCAVVAGALPLIVAALREARSRRSLRILVRLPIVAVLGFTGLTGLLVWIAHSQLLRHSTGIGHGLFIAWMLAGLACGAICVAASRRVLFVLEVSRGRLAWAFALAALLTATMVAIALATALYAVALQLDAARLAATSNGPLGATSTALSLAAQVVVMVIAGAAATIATHRGWSALRRSASQPDELS
jgi:hypothetical protein